MGTDPTVQEHLGDLYQKTGRLKLAAAHWDRAVQEWNKTVPAEQDSEAFAKVQQKLDAAKVKLAKEESGQTLVFAFGNEDSAFLRRFFLG